MYLNATRNSDKVDVSISLEMEKELGRGAFGVVNRMLVLEEKDDDGGDDGEGGGELDEPQEAAVKIPGDDGSLAEIELFLLQKINHANVVTLLCKHYIRPRGHFNC